VLAPLALALVTAFIAFNKVGSPQYITWLAVPIILGLVSARSGGLSFRSPAILVAVLAFLTQLIYPYFYSDLLNLNLLMLMVMSAKNVLLFVLLGWAVAALWNAARGTVKVAEPEPDLGDRRSAPWPLASSQHRDSVDGSDSTAERVDPAERGR